MKQILIITLSVIVTITSFITLDLKAENSSIIEFRKLEDATLSSGSLYRADSIASDYITTRPVDVWLPQNYSEDKKYSVLYMHDGQNLFDSTATWSKQEWKVDEWATKLMTEEKTKDFIVVAIHNIPQIRWQDLYPEKAMGYMNVKVKDSLIDLAKKSNFNVNFKGDEYLQFLVKELKPVIDTQFSVATNRESTFIMGSSMGGLMSMYAISEYPDVFAGAACLSTHWVGAMPSPNNPHPGAIFKYMEANLPKAGAHKLYFDYGNKTLDQHYPKFAPTVDKILEAKGYSSEDSKNLYFEGTDHSGKSWSQRLDQPILFLLGE
ncbi:alpha/beta hydrolase [Winogradskyella sp. PE311]|uniref:alpha/beta hydrolase n=1 Tax=Winogradskyella sp. PE311 TaxID=3366943 RepID=UPI00397E9D4E